MNNPSEPVKFSICVPTRNRAETLYFCLKTLLHQDIDNYEIIVSDNSDPAECEKTLAVIKELASDKIRYFRPDRVLSMTENFEFTLQKSTGEYTLFMGDDDGLVVNTLGYLETIIDEYSPSVIRCPGVVYYWPDSVAEMQYRLSYPVRRPTLQVSSKNALDLVASFDLSYYNLPMIYYGFVKREIIEKIISEAGSLFQDTVNPDIYSGIVIAHYTDFFLITEKPFTIAGLSGKSNGTHSLHKQNSTIAVEFKKKQNLTEKFEKYNVPDSYRFGFDNLILLELLIFKDRHQVEKETYPIDYRKFLINKSLSGHIYEKLNELPYLDEYRDHPFYEKMVKELEEEIQSKKIYNLKAGSSDNRISKHIEIDSKLFHVENVYDAALLSERLGLNYGGVNLMEIKNVDQYLKERRKKALTDDLRKLWKRISYYSGRIVKR